MKAFLDCQSQVSEDEVYPTGIEGLYDKYASPEAWKAVPGDEYARDIQRICPYLSYGSICRFKSCTMARVCRTGRCEGFCGKGIHMPFVCYHFLYDDGKCEAGMCDKYSYDVQRKEAILETPYHDISAIRAEIEKNRNLFPLDAIRCKVKDVTTSVGANGKGNGEAEEVRLVEANISEMDVGEVEVTDSKDDLVIKSLLERANNHGTFK